MDISKLLQRWCVILLPRAWEQCSLEAWSVGKMSMIIDARYVSLLCMWASADQSGPAKAWKGTGAASWFLCAWAAWVCGAMALSLFPSSFLSFFPLSFFYFFEQARSDTFLKQGYSFGCLELCSETLNDFPHTWTFVWKSSVQCRGLLSSVFQLQRASKCSADVVLMFSSIVYPLFFLIVPWNG